MPKECLAAIACTQPIAAKNEGACQKTGRHRALAAALARLACCCVARGVGECVCVWAGGRALELPAAVGVRHGARHPCWAVQMVHAQPRLGRYDSFDEQSRTDRMSGERLA